MDHAHLIDLQVTNGLDMARILHSNVVCSDIITHISEEMKLRITGKIISDKSMVGIIIDDSTTINNKSAFNIYIRARTPTDENEDCNKTYEGSDDNDIYTLFLKLMELADQRADTICNVLLECLRRNGLDENYLRNYLYG